MAILLEPPSLTRRTRPSTVGERLEYDDIILDSETHRVTRKGAGRTRTSGPISRDSNMG